MDLKKCFLLIFITCAFSSCATLFWGPIDTCQKTKPAVGQNRRAIRIIPFILDFPLGLITDFATGAIYKPCSAPPPGTNGKKIKR